MHLARTLRLLLVAGALTAVLGPWLLAASRVRADAEHTISLPLITSRGDVPPPPPPPGPLPAALAGTWFSGQLLNLAYYDRTTGLWGSAGGLGHTVVLTPDGAYTRVSHLELGNGSTCKSSVDVYQTGVVTVEGEGLILTPSYSRTRTVTCGNPSDTEGPYGAVTLPWRVGEDAKGRTRLWLIEPQGETEYYKHALGEQVIGSWANGDGGAIGLYDPATEVWAEPSGTNSEWFALGADGRYRRGRVEAGFRGDPCRPVTMTFEAGALTGSGSQLTLTPDQRLSHVVSLCDPADVVDETLVPGDPHTWGWELSLDRDTLSLIRLFPFGSVTLSRSGGVAETGPRFRWPSSSSTATD